VSGRGPEFEHTLSNQVAIIVGYCELLLSEIPPDSPLRADLLEMDKAARKAMAMLRERESDG
jgi:hypothetical protein